MEEHIARAVLRLDACRAGLDLLDEIRTFAKRVRVILDEESISEPGDFIQSQVTHPGVLNAEDNWLEAAATLDVNTRACR